MDEFEELYADALAWARARNIVLPDEYYNQLSAQARAMAFSIAGITRLDALASVNEHLTRAVENGQTFAQWRKALLADPKALDAAILPKHRLDNIFRTNTQSAYMRGIARQQESPGALKRRPFFQYDAINDSRTRPAHAAMDNYIAAHDDPVWQRWTPPSGYRCFLPGTMVRGDFKIGLKTFYSGPAVELCTGLGKRLSVTANHPILTGRGWVCAKDVEEGDNLLSDHIGVNAFFPGVVDNQNPPASVEDVFNALAGDAFGICQKSSFDFHDDMQFRKGDIHVAGADCLLMDGLLTFAEKRIKDRDFVSADTRLLGGALYPEGMAQPTSVITYPVFSENPTDIAKRRFQRAGKRSLADIRGIFVGIKDHFFQSVIRRASSLPCLAKLSPHKLRAFFDFGPLQDLSLAAASCGNAVVFQETADNATAHAEPFRQSLHAGPAVERADHVIGVFRHPKASTLFSPADHGVSLGFGHSPEAAISKESGKKCIADFELFEQLRRSLAGKITVDQAVGIRHFTFSGHVYDFETKNGLILSDGIITHNCRCIRLALSADEARARGFDGVPKPVPSEPDAGFGSHPLDANGWRGILEAVADRKAKGGPVWATTAAQDLLSDVRAMASE